VEHIVFFPAQDGAPVFRRVTSLEEAVRLVEHLRNVEGVAEVSVHPLGAEVTLAFRAYYRVEVPAPAQAPAEPAAELPAEPAVEPAVTAAVPQQGGPVVEPFADAVPPPVEAVPNGHSSDGVKSLGFFA
jgi:hypothetical protein